MSRPLPQLVCGLNQGCLTGLCNLIASEPSLSPFHSIRFLVATTDSGRKENFARSHFLPRSRLASRTWSRTQCAWLQDHSTISITMFRARVWTTLPRASGFNLWVLFGVYWRKTILSSPNLQSLCCQCLKVGANFLRYCSTNSVCFWVPTFCRSMRDYQSFRK